MEIYEAEPEELVIEVEPVHPPPSASPEVAELHGHVLALRAEGARMREENAALRTLVERSLTASEAVAESLSGFRALFRRVGDPRVIGAALVALDMIPKLYKWIVGHL